MNLHRASNKMPRPGGRRLLARVLLALGSFVVTLAIVELAFRVCGVRGHYERMHEHVFLPATNGPRMCSRGGYVPLATHRTLYFTDPRGYFGPGAAVDHHFNSAGWRDRERAIARSASTVRILGLGDSYLMGQGVHEADVCLGVTEAWLNHKAQDVEYEAINTGISGKNTRDEAEVLRQRGWDYEPQLVVLHFVPNDVEQDLAQEGPLVEFYRNYTRLIQSPDRLSAYSYLWSWGRQRVLQEVVARRYIRESAASFATDSAKWQHCRAALDDIQAQCREHGTALAVVSFPFFHDLDGEYPFAAIHERVAEYCRGAQIAHLDLRAIYARFHGPELWVHPTDQHPNERAHALAGEAIGRFLWERREQLGIAAPRPLQRSPADVARIAADACIVQLAGMRSAGGDIVSFAGQPLGDGDLRLMMAHWAALPKVRRLMLARTQIADDSLPVLAALPQLEVLDLSGTRASGTSIRALARLEALTELGLAGLPVGDDDLAALSALASLRTINLAGSAITDAAASTLQGWPRLETVSVAHTHMSGAGIRVLAAIKTLRTLAVSANQCDAPLQAELRRSRPDLQLVVER
ncbi:MAG: hypothetical protein K1X74_21155 [Pirellulales bacterium]|nr:hypothetical protein [Pirellulales bacterium]